jgi:thiamine pyrophosphate-dependent acetolactate synthase large subunit-like protein
MTMTEQATGAHPQPRPRSGGQQSAPEHVTGAQSLIRSLEEVGAETVFGIPGGAILPAYDPLMDSTRVRHVLVRHEQGAGHAATGYAQATGKVGVCMATSGPGATNLVTPIADAHMDSVPLVAITGQVASKAIGTDAFQEADIVGITMPITKHNFLVTKAEDIPRVIAQAFHIASTDQAFTSQQLNTPPDSYSKDSQTPNPHPTLTHNVFLRYPPPDPEAFDLPLARPSSVGLLPKGPSRPSGQVSSSGDHEHHHCPSSPSHRPQTQQHKLC